MEASFWSGLVLDNFMFSHVSIKSYPEFIGVCFIAATIALAFEGSRTVRDWLYLEFLKKRSCYRASNDTAIVLRDVSSNGMTEFTSKDKVEATGKDATEMEQKCNSNNDIISPIAVPVIATGTLQGTDGSCRKPGFHVGLMELLLSTLLHMFQVILGYVLMLMVMTFNVWIFMAVLAGTSIGFFIFDSFNKKIHALKVNASK